MELTEGSETLAYINQMPGNYPKGNLLQSLISLYVTHFYDVKGVSKA